MKAILKKPSLSRSSPEPLYLQLAQHIEAEIRSGRLKHGDRLESESRLSERFAVSRITLRQAIGNLARKNILVRRQGKGTFVTRPTVKHNLQRLHGLLGSLFAQAESASTRLLHYELTAAPTDIAELLGIRTGERALRLDRVFQIGGRSIALAHVWLAPEVAALPRAKADLISTEDMMVAAGIRIASSEVSIRAETAGTMVGRLLKVPARTPVLVLRRTAKDTDGVVKEAGCVWFCSDAYEFVCTTDSPGPVEHIFDIRNVEERL